MDRGRTREPMPPPDADKTRRADRPEPGRPTRKSTSRV